MPTTHRDERYSLASITLHWLMLVLMVAAYATIELREVYPRGSVPREALKTWHFTLGLSVFALVWLRIVFRLIWPGPAPVENGWRHAVSGIIHASLYGLMIGIPFAGWLILSAQGEAVPFFGLRLPPLVAESRLMAEQAEEIHELGGTVGYWLIGIHASASLFHHYVLRDGLLARMLPTRALNAGRFGAMPDMHSAARRSAYTGSRA